MIEVIVILLGILLISSSVAVILLGVVILAGLLYKGD